MGCVRGIVVSPVRSLLLLGALAWCVSVGGSEAAVVVAAPAGGTSPAEGKGISVVGMGQAKGKPVVVEFMAVASGEGELASDAIVKHRDTKRRALKAIEDLKIAGLTIEPRGFAINQAMDPNMQQMMMRGQAPTNTKQMVQVAEQLRIVLRDVNKLKDEDVINTVLKVLDTARDGGLVVGAGTPNFYQMQMMMQSGQTAGLAAFKIPDPAPLRAQAYQKAMEDARAKAQRLAELSGGKLGRVLAVQEGPSGPQQGNQMMAMIYGMMQQQQNLQDPELSSSSFGEITLGVTLSVQFALE